MLFACVGLSRGSGGVAQLSRQAVAVLDDLHRAGEIRLQIRVLEDAAPAAGDALFAPGRAPCDVRWFAGSRWRFSMDLLAQHPDLLLFDHVGLGRVVAWLGRPFGLRYMAFIHGVEIWKADRNDYLRTARRASRLIANSSYTASRARQHCPDLPEIRICWPGRDELRREAPDVSIPAGRIGPHALLIVGRLDAQQRHKGHDHLIEAMPMILDRVPDAQLLIVGDGGDRDRLEGRVRELGLADAVLFPGHLDEAQLQAVYSACAVFAMPSDGDGFGLVFLEAMMHRLPCVGLAGGAAAEIFEDEVSGLLVDREDRTLLADRLSGLLLDAPRRARLGASGYEVYRRKFRSEHYAQRLRAALLDAPSDV